MDAVKAKTSPTVQATEAPKRTQAPQAVKAEDKPAHKPETGTMKKVAYEQPKWSAKLNVLNVFNKRYYESVYDNGGHVVPGTERAVQLTTTFKF